MKKMITNYDTSKTNDQTQVIRIACSHGVHAVHACFRPVRGSRQPSRRNPESKASEDSTAVTVGEEAMFGNG